MISWEKMVGRKKPAYNSHVGLTMRAPNGDVVVVKVQSTFYVSEGGLDMGYDDDQGWVLKLTARPAGQNETSMFLAREARGLRW